MKEIKVIENPRKAKLKAFKDNKKKAKTIEDRVKAIEDYLGI